MVVCRPTTSIVYWPLKFFMFASFSNNLFVNFFGFFDWLLFSNANWVRLQFCKAFVKLYARVLQLQQPPPHLLAATVCSDKQRASLKRRRRRRRLCRHRRYIKRYKWMTGVIHRRSRSRSRLCRSLISVHNRIWTLLQKFPKWIRCRKTMSNNRRSFAASTFSISSLYLCLSMRMRAFVRSVVRALFFLEILKEFFVLLWACNIIFKTSK